MRKCIFVYNQSGSSPCSVRVQFVPRCPVEAKKIKGQQQVILTYILLLKKRIRYSEINEEYRYFVYYKCQRYLAIDFLFSTILYINTLHPCMRLSAPPNTRPGARLHTAHCIIG